MTGDMIFHRSMIYAVAGISHTAACHADAVVEFVGCLRHRYTCIKRRPFVFFHTNEVIINFTFFGGETHIITAGVAVIGNGKTAGETAVFIACTLQRRYQLPVGIVERNGALFIWQHLKGGIVSIGDGFKIQHLPRTIDSPVGENGSPVIYFLPRRGVVGI